MKTRKAFAFLGDVLMSMVSHLELELVSLISELYLLEILSARYRSFIGIDHGVIM